MRTTVDNRRTSPWPWVVFALIALAGLYLLQHDPTPPASAVIAPEPPPAQTVVIAVPTYELNIEVRPRFVLPTATPLPTPTFMGATPAPTMVTWCGTPIAGATCTMRPVATSTPNPLPTCPANPGVRCQWVADEDYGPGLDTGEAETQ